MTRSPHPYARLIIGRDGRKQPPSSSPLPRTPRLRLPRVGVLTSHIYRASSPPELAHRVLLLNLPLRLLLVVGRERSSARGEASKPGSSNRAWFPPPPPRGLTQGFLRFGGTTSRPRPPPLSFWLYDRRLFVLGLLVSIWFGCCLVSSLLCSAPSLPQRALDPRSFPLAFFSLPVCHLLLPDFIYLFMFWRMLLGLQRRRASPLPCFSFPSSSVLLRCLAASATHARSTSCAHGVPLLCLVFCSEK